MFYCVLVRFVGKMTKNSKFWAMSRVLRSGEETPRNSEGPRSGEETPRNGEGPRSGEGPPRRREAKKEDFSILEFVAAKPLFNMEMLCFCFVLFFCCSEGLSIGLIRIL